MSDDSKLRFALALVTGRLHKAQGDKRCGCGPCGHRIALAAKQAGISRKRLEQALPPAAKPEPPRRRRRRPMRVQICESSVVRVRGRDINQQEGLAILLARLHGSDPDR